MASYAEAWSRSRRPADHCQVAPKQVSYFFWEGNSVSPKITIRRFTSELLAINMPRICAKKILIFREPDKHLFVFLFKYLNDWNFQDGHCWKFLVLGSLASHLFSAFFAPGFPPTSPSPPWLRLDYGGLSNSLLKREIEALLQYTYNNIWSFTF